MEKMDKIQCKYIEDYPDIQKSSIHISSETKNTLMGQTSLNLKNFFALFIKVHISFLWKSTNQIQ